MKKVRFLSSVVVLLLASLLILSSCAKNNKDTTSSYVISSEITASENVTSVPEKETESSSSQPEVTSKPQTSSNSSKPNTPTKPSVSSKPHVSPRPVNSSTTTQNTASNSFKDKWSTELFEGKWKANVDISPKLKGQGYNLTGSAHVGITYEFFGNRTGACTIDKPSFLGAMEWFLGQTLDAELAANNLTQQEFESQIGMTIDEYIKATANSMGGYATTYTFNYMFDADSDGMSINFQTGPNSYIGYKYEFKSADTLVIKEEYGQLVTYTRVK